MRIEIRASNTSNEIAERAWSWPEGELPAMLPLRVRRPFTINGNRVNFSEYINVPPVIAEWLRLQGLVTAPAAFPDMPMLFFR